MKRYWTEKEIKYLKEAYNQKKPLKIIAKTLNRSIESVRHKADRLNLTPKNDAHIWSKDELDWLCENYKYMTIKEAADHLNINKGAVEYKANMLNLKSRVGLNRQKWTKEEIAWLEQYYERSGAYVVAKHLNRSIESVKHKAQKLHLQCYINEWTFLKGLAKAFDSDPSVIHRWRKKYGLKMKTQKHGKIIMYRIHADEFWIWAEEHKDIIPFYKYVKGSLLPEPEWINEAIKNDTKTNHRKNIYKKDIKYVLTQHANGKSFENIANDLHRTVDAVKHIYVKNNKIGV